MTTRRRPHLALCAMLICSVAGSAQGPARDAGVPVLWDSIAIPGGFASLQQAAHLARPAEEWRTIPLLIELSFSGPEGLRHTRHIAAYAADLRRRRTPPLATRDSAAPLPLGAAFWESRFAPAPPPHELLWAILGSREMSSLYYGLLALDDETLRAVADDRALAAALVRHAGRLPMLADGLRIEQGRVAAAGGDGAAPLWEALVGKRLDRPAEFVNALLGADEGRLAYFYRTVATLPASTAAFVIGGAATPVDARRGTFRQLYATFEAALQGWRADALIQPPPGGPADVLFTIATRADGTLAGPPWTEFWRLAFASADWIADPVRAAADLDLQRTLDAAALLEVLCPGACDPDRVATLALVQRQFPDVAPARAGPLLAAARTSVRYPALAFEIARMNLGDPSVHMQLGGLAASIDRLVGGARALALVQFQSAVVFLARLRAVGVPAAAVLDQAARLAALPLSERGFDGGVARWLALHLFAAAPGEDVDLAADRALAGGLAPAGGATLTWEEVVYRVDPAAAEQARIRECRTRFTANTLATAVALVRLSDEIPAAVAEGTVAPLLERATAVVADARDVHAVAWPGSLLTVRGFASLPAELSRTLRKVRPGDRRSIDRAAHLLRTAADVVTADALAARVYALALQDVENTLALSQELPRRHQLVPGARRSPGASAWTFPVHGNTDREDRSISGPLLGLDVGTPDFTVRRMAAGRPEREPNMARPLAVALQRTVALTSPWTVRPDEPAALEGARVRGAGIVDRWRAARRPDRPLSAAGIAGPRAGWLRWALARGEAHTLRLRLEDLVRLGGWRQPGEGAAVTPTCACRTVPETSWELRGQPRDADTAIMLLVEPALRVAAELHRRGLPAALAPGVLALFTTDLIEQSSLPHPLDVAGIIEASARTPAARFDDYIASVAARGPLVRADADRERQP
jgi:hypothetical protein